MPGQPTILPPKTSSVPTGPRKIPVLPVRDTVLFPHAVLPLTVGRESSIQLIESLGEERSIIVAAQLDPSARLPQARRHARGWDAGHSAQSGAHAQPEPVCVH